MGASVPPSYVMGGTQGLVCAGLQDSAPVGHLPARAVFCDGAGLGRIGICVRGRVLALHVCLGRAQHDLPRAHRADLA